MRIKGTKAGDGLLGSAGGDVVYGRQGGDNLDGGRGDDVIFGGRGRDTLVGGDGADVLKGGQGRDTFVLATDSFTYFDEAQAVDRILDFNPGVDRIVIVAPLGVPLPVEYDYRIGVLSVVVSGESVPIADLLDGLRLQPTDYLFSLS